MKDLSLFPVIWYVHNRNLIHIKHPVILCCCAVLRESNLPHALLWLKAAVASVTAHNKGMVTATTEEKHNITLSNTMANHLYISFISVMYSNVKQVWKHV